MDVVNYDSTLVYGLHEEMTNQVELGNVYKFVVI